MVENKEQSQRKSIQHKVREGQHFYISGKTGMGKTVLIKAIINTLTRQQPFINVYHIDTKKRGDFSARDGQVIVSENAPEAFKEAGGYKMVWQPVFDDKNEYSKFFLNILNAGIPAIVNIDECINMVFSHEIPRGLAILLAQGRKPGIWVLGGSQQIADSPRTLLSQATHVMSFNMTNKYDVSTAMYYLKMNAQKGERKELGLKRFQFYHIKPDYEDLPVKYDSFEDFLPTLS